MGTRIRAARRIWAAFGASLSARAAVNSAALVRSKMEAFGVLHGDNGVFSVQHQQSCRSCLLVTRGAKCSQITMLALVI
jgi:hypothetical protein